MSRIRIPSFEETPPASQPILTAAGEQLGFIPNVHRLMALSPAALSGWTDLMKRLNRTLDLETRNGIALAVSAVNDCRYCLMAHSSAAMNLAKTAPEEIALNKQGRSGDPKRAAAIHFAKTLTEKRGKVSDDDLRLVREAGYTDAQIVEIGTLAVQFLLTNFMNNIAETDSDFTRGDSPRAG